MTTDAFIQQPGSAAIALCNPKSPSNVGAILRATGCFDAGPIYYTGSRFKQAARYHQDTKNVHSRIDLSWTDSVISIVRSTQQLVCVELVEGATPLPAFQHPLHAIYCFGPEDGSIDQSLVDQADSVVYIPTLTCMNLAASVNVVLYDRLAKQSIDFSGDELIRSSRDINNRLSIHY